MPELTPEILQLGTVAILFLLFIKEFFAYLRNKKNNKNGEIIKAINILEQNHLKDISSGIQKMDDKLDKIITALEVIKERLK